MNRGLQISVFGFLLLFLSQAATGVGLFLLKYGWTAASLKAAFENENGAPTWSHFFETAIPHVAAIAAIAFILGHFLAFVPNFALSHRLALSLGLLLSGTVNALSGSAMILWGDRGLVVKILTFGVFQFFLLAVTVVILKSAISSLHSCSAINSINR